MSAQSVMKHALFASAITAAIAGYSAPASAEEAAKEKCYGVAKAGKNDCAGKAYSCAGQSKTDGASDAFITVPKGLCDRLTGGSTTPKE